MVHTPVADQPQPAWLGEWQDRMLATPGRKRVTATCCYLLVIVTGALFVAMREINGALGQMRLPGSAGGGALQFPLQWDGRRADSAVAELSRSWAAYVAQVKPTRVIAEPRVLVERLFWLDLAFIASYTVLLIAVLVLASRFQPNDDGPAAALRPVHQRMLWTALLCTVPLAVVDVLEDFALRAAYLDDWRAAVAIGPIPVGPLLSMLKLLLVALVVVPLLVAGVATLHGSASWRRAVIASRAVSIVVAIAVLLLATGIGADQVDDVIRAWNWPYALFATLASVLAALVVVGTITELTGASVDNPAPDCGKDPNWVVIRVAVVLGAAGGVCWAVGLGWGLLVPAGMALLGALLSAPLTRFMPKDGKRDPQEARPNPELVATNGVRLARAAGAGLLAVLIWVLVRAATFDLAVRAASTRWMWVATLGCAAVALAVTGTLVLVKQAPSGRTRWMWVTLASVATLILLATLVPALEVTLPTSLGTVAVLMLGLAGGAGVLTAAVAASRQRPVRRLRLVPAVRVLGLQRLPVVTLVVIWAALVAVLDRGGFHDIRTLPAAAPGPPPTLEQAYRAWLDAGADKTPQGAARPLVLVAAQGGGIRAAVWTALVMECVFGPGPVVASDGCKEGASETTPAAKGHTVREQPLPVFLASGASGGSVGLAVWSAHRVDLASGGAVAAQTPKQIEAALGADFVAPDLARLLSGDLAYLLFAHNLPDRAEVMESAWERPWPGGRTGMSRGLRETYQQANGAPRQWRIPILALNGAQVEDGCRLLASPVDFHVSAPGHQPRDTPDGDRDTPGDTTCGTVTGGGPLSDVLPRTTELVDYLCPATDVPLSTAAHLSARFPFVSPTGRVSRGDCANTTGLLPPQSISYDIDGGLFDNSGAGTALDAWRALAPLAAAGESAAQRCVVPVFLQIDNSDPEQPELGPDSPPLELLAPASALLGEIGSRETMARATAATAFGPPRSPAGSPVRVDGRDIKSLWFRVALAGQPGPQPPLGWTLAGSTVDDMRAQLSTEKNRAAIAELRHLLTAPLRCG